VIRCTQCRFENDDTVSFCEECGAKLTRSCPGCGSEVKPQAKFCGKCGHPLAEKAPPPSRPATLDAKLDQIQRYLPQHVTEKILAGRGRLEGERKVVTVLFADLSGYTTLSEKLGEEALFATMDEFYELLIHEGP